MSDVLSREIAVVTGGASGIGRATVGSLANLGAHVVIAARCHERSDAYAREQRLRGHRVSAVALDVASPPSVAAGFGTIRAEVGNPTILVNNAGVTGYAPFLDSTSDAFADVVRINLFGAELCCREVLRDMAAAGRGVIVNVGSMWATKGGPNRAAYVTSKHGLLGLTRALSAEFAPLGIRVTIVNPGPVSTPTGTRTAEKVGAGTVDGWLRPSEVADVVAFVCSPQGAALAGTAIDLPGQGDPIELLTRGQ